MNTNMDIVEVRWDDAWIDTEDYDIEEAKLLKPIRRTTVGFLVAEREDALVLCTDKFEKDDKCINAPMVIPKGMIVNYWYLDISKAAI